jgi:hypothetical protein
LPAAFTEPRLMKLGQGDGQSFPSLPAVVTVKLAHGLNEKLGPGL